MLSIVFTPEPDAELATQLRALTSAMLAAEALPEKDQPGRTLFVARPHDDTPTVMDLLEAPRFAEPPGTGAGASWYQRATRILYRPALREPTAWIKSESLRHHELNNIGCDVIATALKSRARTWIVQTGSSFCRYETPVLDFYNARRRMYARLAPVAAVRKAVQAFQTEHFCRHMIGVHLDKRPPAEMLDAFFAMIDREIEAHAQTRLFLTGGHPGAVGRIMERYGKRVSSRAMMADGVQDVAGHVRLDQIPCEQTRTAATMCNSLIDLVLLSRTDKIVGTSSATSYEAAILGDVPLVEISVEGVRQTYELIPGKKVIIDFRDNGLGIFHREPFRRRGKRAELNTPDAWDRGTIGFFYDELRKLENPIVFDIGSNTGAFALAATFVKGCRVHAFEPNRELIPVLESNLALNLTRERVRVHDVGLLDQPGPRALKVPADGRLGLSTYGDDVIRFDAYRAVETRVVTLDDFVCDNRITRIDFLKMDTEGAEYAILRGSRRTIETMRPRLPLEVNDENLAQFGLQRRTLLELVASMGYSHRFISHEDLYCWPQEQGL